MNEFDLIDRYFAGLTPRRADVLFGIGDDCALLQPPPGETLAVTTDTLVAGRHFPADAAPFDIGWKSLAVSLSDLAAMGVEPRWFTLALTLPEADKAWLQGFAGGLRAATKDSGIALVGGDTTRGPLSITITAIGTARDSAVLRRSGAKPGDAVCVTGTLGDAALGLQLWPQRTASAEPDADHAFLFERLHRPQARVAAGITLRDIAHAAIDLSDGLAGDLQHILGASGVGAEVWLPRLPTSPAFERLCAAADRFALQAGGGDDYELCVCLPFECMAEVAARLDVPLTEIGRVSERPGLRWREAGGQQIDVPVTGYRHF